MRTMKPGNIVDTPQGRGWLLYPVLRTQHREWVVIIGKKIYEVRVDEMLGTSQDVPSICLQNNETWISPEDMSTAGTRQMEMKL